MKTLQDYIDKLKALNFKEMYEGDFFLTWEKTDAGAEEAEEDVAITRAGPSEGICKEGKAATEPY